MITKLTAEELKNVKLKEITSVIGNKMSAAEKDKLKGISTADERREFLIEMYNKYIDLAIADENESVKNEAVEAAKAEETAKKEEAVATSIKEAESSLPNVSAKTDAGDINTSMSFTVVIRGVSGHNGTFTITCDRLLLVAFRNPMAIITFRNPQRASQFVNIVQNVKHVKGIANITSDARKHVIDRIKQINNLK